jgi:hypothetical protein
MRSVKITLDCGSIAQPTVSTIDQMARLQLNARRCGCKLELRDANPRLLELIGFAGLGGVLCVEVEGQAEQREDPRCVKKKGELGDPPVG